MPNNAAEHFPHIHEFLVGKHGERQPTAEKGLVGILKREQSAQRAPIFCNILNTGEDPFDFLVRQSDDNNVTDKYAGEQAVGTITFDGGNNPADTEQIVINDGVNSVIFEFESGGGITGDVAVTIGGDAATTLANLKTAIEGTALDVVVTDTTDGGDPQLTVTVVTPSDASNNAITNTGANITTTGLAGGSDSNPVTIRLNSADVSTGLVTVEPGGFSIFVIEGQGTTVKQYLRFDTVEEAAKGQLLVVNWSEDYERRQRPDVP